MSAEPRSLNHTHRRLVTFVQFIQRVLGPTAARNLFAALLEHLTLSLRFMRSKWHIICGDKVNCSSLVGPTHSKIDAKFGSTFDTAGDRQLDGQSKEQASVSQSNIYEQIVIPVDNVACSLYPTINGMHDDPSSRSSQMPDAPTSSQSPESNRPTLPHISVSGDDSCSATYSMISPQPYLVSSPIDIRGHPQVRRSDSTESVVRLASGEMSRNDTLVTGISVEPRVTPSIQDTLIASPTCVKDAEIPNLDSGSITPRAPEYFTRYEKRRKIPPEATKVKMSPFLRDFSDHDDIPEWTACVHPGGCPYFYHAGKRIFTDVNLHYSSFFDRIMEGIKNIEDFMHEHEVQIPEKTDLVLDLNIEGDFCYTDYYFADHESRTIFFLDEFSSEWIPHWAEIKGISSGTHLRQALETQYWWHCHSYPNCIELTNSLVCELRSEVLHFISSCMTSPYTNSPYTLDKLEKILSHTDSLNRNVGGLDSGCISFLGRFMYSFSTLAFFTQYTAANLEARLNRDESVYGHRTNKRTWFIKSISILLFSAPDIHLKTLQKMWVDGILHKNIWEDSLKKLTDEWREFTLYATVLLNANMAFLAIQSVDTNRNPYRSPAQISSYCSISSSVGSIVLGLLLVRQNQTKHRVTVHDVQDFLSKRAHPWLGLETVAIMFSLPYALLMWGMASFLVAFWFMCLQESGPATRSVVVTVCCIILVLIVWCIQTSWEKQPASDSKEDDQEFLSFESTRYKQKSKRFKFERVTPEPEVGDPEQSSIRDPPLPFNLPFRTVFRNIRRSTSKTMVEESVVDEQGTAMSIIKSSSSHEMV